MTKELYTGISKPANVLIFEKDPLLCKLSDFGLPKIVWPGQEPKSFVGTHPYVAPEVFDVPKIGKKKRKQESGYTEKVDIWSLGILAWIFITGDRPEIRNKKEVETWRPNLEVLNDALSEFGVNLILKLLSPTAEERPSADELCFHRWFLHSPVQSFVPSQLSSRDSQVRIPIDLYTNQGPVGSSTHLATESTIRNVSGQREQHLEGHSALARMESTTRAVEPDDYSTGGQLHFASTSEQHLDRHSAQLRTESTTRAVPGQHEDQSTREEDFPISEQICFALTNEQHLERDSAQARTESAIRAIYPQHEGQVAREEPEDHPSKQLRFASTIEQYLKCDSAQLRMESAITATSGQ